jgi:two-component system, OmpR family, response regulator
MNCVPAQGYKRAHVLVVDDEPAMCTMLSRYFSKNGFRTSVAASGEAMMGVLEQEPCDLILLDLNLGDEDGLDLIRALSSRARPPVIIITSRNHLIDRIVGLELGADDYISKPFHLREVLARAKNVLRRHRRDGRSEEADSQEHVVYFEGWRLNFDRRQVMRPDGCEVLLTAGEFQLLSVFVNHAGRVLDRNQLLDLTHGPGWHAYDRTIDAQVARLRRKIEADPTRPALIKSVHGAGYVFTGRISKTGAAA